MPDDDQAPESATANAVAQAMMLMSAGIEPIFETANAMRQRLIDEGWSPEAAEAITREFVLGLIRKLFPT